jgi:hypothetical protein
MSRRGRSRACIGALLLAACVSVAAPARAQDQAGAEALFREGRRLLEAGQIDAACAKLAESQRLDPSSGTLLNLAACHEKQGKTATAWAEYLSAARLSRTQGKTERAEQAAQRAAALEPELSYLTVNVTERVDGLEIRRGDVRMEAATLGSKLPVDPGEHVLTISAPGHEPVELKVTIAPKGDSQTVTVPALRKLASGEAEAPLPPKPKPTEPEVTSTESKPSADRDATADSRGAPIAAYVIGGAGIVFTGVGAVFGLMAKSAYEDAESACPTRTSCSEDAMEQRDQAQTRATIANIGIGVGLAGVAVGTVLLLTSGGSGGSPAASHRKPLRLLPSVGASHAGVVVSGHLF